MKKGEGCLLIILTAVIFLLNPILIYCLGWLGGWILSQIVGTAITNGFNILFDTTRFTPELIPITCGALAVIGSYFKTSASSSKD